MEQLVTRLFERIQSAYEELGTRSQSRLDLLTRKMWKDGDTSFPDLSGKGDVVKNLLFAVKHLLGELGQASEEEGYLAFPVDTTTVVQFVKTDF